MTQRRKPRYTKKLIPKYLRTRLQCYKVIGADFVFLLIIDFMAVEVMLIHSWNSVI